MKGLNDWFGLNVPGAWTIVPPTKRLPCFSMTSAPSDCAFSSFAVKTAGSDARISTAIKDALKTMADIFTSVNFLIVPPPSKVHGQTETDFFSYTSQTLFNHLYRLPTNKKPGWKHLLRADVKRIKAVIEL